MININGFSLLGKSNEEAMQILREAMQVEAKPGFIQLTVSRKLKQANNDYRVKIVSDEQIKVEQINEDHFDNDIEQLNGNDVNSNLIDYESKLIQINVENNIATVKNNNNNSIENKPFDIAGTLKNFKFISLKTLMIFLNYNIMHK